MDGLATMGLARTFDGVPWSRRFRSLRFQGSVALLGKIAGQWLGAGELLDNLNAVAGLLIFAVALVILQIKRIALADYLPSVIVAPAIAFLFR